MTTVLIDSFNPFFVSTLKHACGYEFTNKFHRMFTDINVSEDLNDKFTTHSREKNSQLGIDFSILVLQAGAWPISQSNLPTFSLPQELEKSVKAVIIIQFLQFLKKCALTLFPNAGRLN